jgi:phosphatidylglycerophosphate synthase
MVQALTGLRLILSIALPVTALGLSARATFFVYLAAMTTDIIDGALARHWQCATRGGDWFDAFADRMLTTMSAVYGLVVGAATLPCSLIIARDLSAVSMNELQSEGANQRARFLGIITVTPIRVVTVYVMATHLYDLMEARHLSLAYWLCAGIGWLTFAVNAWLRRSTVASRFREPDVEKLLRSLPVR